MLKVSNFLSYFVYVPLMLALILRTHRQIHRQKARTKVNKWQMVIYSVLLLGAPFLFIFEVGIIWPLFFDAVATLVLGALLFFEGMEYGKTEATRRLKDLPASTEEGKGKKDNVLKNAKNTCILTGIAAFLALANVILGLLINLPIIFQ